MNPTPMKTPQPITYMIVGTICVAFLSTVGANIYAVIMDVDVMDSLSFMSLKSIIDTTLGAIVGFLANTRSAEVKVDGTRVETTTSTTKTPLPDEDKAP